MHSAEQIQESMDGTGSSFERLFDQHWGRVVRVLARLVGDVDEAEDLALEVFYKLHHQMNRSSPGEIKDGWIYRVAVNVGLNALRSGNRRRRYEREAGMQHLASQFQDSPAAETEKREVYRQVRMILGHMKPRSVNLLVLMSAGLSYREMAQTLQIRVSSVGALLSRAEREFEKRYRERFGENDDQTSE